MTLAGLTARRMVSILLQVSYAYYRSQRLTPASGRLWKGLLMRCIGNLWLRNGHTMSTDLGLSGRTDLAEAEVGQARVAGADAGSAHHVRVLQDLLLRRALPETESRRRSDSARQVGAVHGHAHDSICLVKRTQFTVEKPHAAYCKPVHECHTAGPAQLLQRRPN
jgi:hypothetical protein